MLLQVVRWGGLTRLEQLQADEELSEGGLAALREQEWVQEPMRMLLRRF